jgi:TonB family protein
MIRLSHTGLLTIALVGAAFLLGEIARANAQPTTSAPDETARAIALYQQGQNEEAINALRIVVKRNKNDLQAWHYLGLALEKQGDAKEALKAHEKAAKLGDQLLNQLDQASSSEDVLRAGAQLKNNIAAAANSAEKYVALNATLSKSKREAWRIRTLSLQGLAEITNADTGIGPIYSAKDVTVKARVLSKPEPPYTEEARRNQVSGTVILKVIFSAYGRVIGVRAVSGLPYGLTESAIRAARQIRFSPALKDGKPVSMYAQLEYTFTVF